MVRPFWVSLLALAIVAIPTIAFAQDDCDAYCNDPVTYCSSNACFDGQLRTTCRMYATHYNSNPYLCEEPPPPQYQIRYPQDGIDWNTTPNSHAIPGECFGNCGGGCSDAWNPCGGPTQYWELTYCQRRAKI